MNKPKLSFWQIWNLSFGFLGVQIGYSLQNSNTSSIFESLGADVSHLSYFWLAAPLAGMIIQPIIGLFSDGTWTRLGRRIPYILGGVDRLGAGVGPHAQLPAAASFRPFGHGSLHPALHGSLVQCHDAALPGPGSRHARRPAENPGLCGTDLPDQPRSSHRCHPAADHDATGRLGRSRAGKRSRTHRLFLFI